MNTMLLTKANVENSQPKQTHWKALYYKYMVEFTLSKKYRENLFEILISKY
jgi:hypothetical protein